MNIKDLEVTNVNLADDFADDNYVPEPVTLSAFKYKTKYATPYYKPNTENNAPDFGTDVFTPTLTYIPPNSQDYTDYTSPNGSNSEVNISFKSKSKRKQKPLSAKISPDEKQEIKTKLEGAIKEVGKISDTVENKILGLPKKQFWIGAGILTLIVGILLVKK